MYRRILKNGSRARYVNTTLPRLFSADSTPIKAQAQIDVDVKLGGMTFPFEFTVVENIGFDCILGMDLLGETKAVIDIPRSVLTLFEGLTAINMTVTGSHVTVSTISAVIIPPFSLHIIKHSREKITQ
jgi:hypothetical protein